MPLSIVIAAGGTGGHIFPGLALAGAIRELAPDARVAFVGTPRGLERSLIPARGYPLHLVGMRPFTRSLGMKPILGVLSMFRATVQARRILRSVRASAVVGMGGYASLPVVVAAWRLGIPRIVHESGAVPGLANRVAARFTRDVALSFPDAAGRFPRRTRTRVVGTPLSPELAGVDRIALRAEGRRAYRLPQTVTAVLVLGGSLGAMRLNEVGVGLAARWRERDDLRVVLKAGRDHLDTIRAEVTELGADQVVTTVAFIDRMDEAYAAADVALCRAGAGTVAELAAGGVPAVVVPYPHAPDDHQTKNAAALVRAGAAVLVPDGEATADRIAPILEELAADPARRERMSKAARELARPDAARELARWVLHRAGRRSEAL
jgi:UDP-N-acetylglucosamine--N-acetylmuramyl-(pentapeptide) pyrophosphoryl-undecaprenol N-acetylglucosamine transferase